MELIEGRADVDRGAFLDRLDEIGEENGCAIQAFDARYVAGRPHVERAAALATRAHERGEGIVRDRAVEILLYAAGRRQIEQALEMGVPEGGGELVVVVDADPGVESDEASAAAAVRELLAPAAALAATDEQRVCSFFDIGECERRATDAALVELVCERVALLAVER